MPFLATFPKYSCQQSVWRAYINDQNVILKFVCLQRWWQDGTICREEDGRAGDGVVAPATEHRYSGDYVARSRNSCAGKVLNCNKLSWISVPNMIIMMSKTVIIADGEVCLNICWVKVSFHGFLQSWVCKDFNDVLQRFNKYRLLICSNVPKAYTVSVALN